MRDWRERLAQVEQFKSEGMKTNKAAARAGVKLASYYNWRKKTVAGKKPQRASYIDVPPAAESEKTAAGNVVLVVCAPNQVAEVLRNLQ